jgi:hypothetical protein
MEADLKFLMLPDIVMRRRIHDDNSSVRNRHAKKDYVKIMKAALDRKRKKEAEQQQNSTNPETGK